MCSASRFREDNSVDDVNDAVVGDEISFDDFCVIDRDAGIRDVEAYLLTLDGFGLHGFYVGGHDFAGHDVIGQNGNEFRLVFRFEEVFDSALGEFGKGSIGGSEDGEGTFTLQCFDESCGLYSGDQSFEVIIPCGESDDVLA